MPDTIRIVLTLSSAILALVTGIIVLEKLTKFYRLLFLQVLIYLILDCLSLPFAPDNGWVFNILVAVETALLFAAAQAYFNTTKSKYVLLFLYGLFFVVYCVDLIIVTGIYTFAYHASLMEGILITGIYLTILYFQLEQRVNAFDSWPVTFICLGMAMYFAGSIPYLSTMFYFQKMDPVLNLKLFRNIIEVLAHVRYVCIAIAFYLAGRGSQ